MIDFFPTRPIFITIGSWSMYWYGVLYVVGALQALWMLPRLQRYRNFQLTRDRWYAIVVAVLAGVLIGGRLGYVLGYEFLYYWYHPLEIWALRQGGMASHGGFIGAGIALWVMSRRYRIDFFALADIVVVPGAIALAIGRIGNVINQEIWAESMLMLPAWLAVAKNIIVALVCLHHLYVTQLATVVKNDFRAGPADTMHPRPTASPADRVQALDGGPPVWHPLLRARFSWYVVTKATGQTFALGLLTYGVLRFGLDFLRPPFGTTVAFGSLMLNQSQLLTVPLIVLGAGLLWYRRRPSP